MNSVAVSPKFQVVIPLAVRKALGLRVGQRMIVRINQGKVELEPEKTVASLRGKWQGMDISVERDADRHL